MDLIFITLLFVSTILANGNGYNDFLDAAGQEYDEMGTPFRRNALKDLKTRWPGGVVPVLYEGTFSMSETNIVQRAIGAIERATCVRFPLAQTLPAAMSQKRYLSLKKRTVPGCGTPGLGMPPDNQLPAHIYLNGAGCFSKAILIHEILHILGLDHMHQYYNRDQYVDIHYENIKQGKESQFRMSAPDILTDFGYPYDYDSIMHYSNNYHSKNGQQTITAKEVPFKALGNDELSETDIEKIKKMYCL